MDTEINASATLTTGGALAAPSMPTPSHDDTEALDWRVWSDGAALGNPGPSAWAIYVLRPDGTAYTQYGSADHRTNNRAEMLALLQAIKAIPIGQTGVIYSDSKHALGTATTWRVAWERSGMKTSQRKPVEHQDLVVRLWEELDKRPGVRLEWVRGHAGNEGNEIVDALATRAARAVQVGKKPVGKVTREIPTRTQ